MKGTLLETVNPSVKLVEPVVERDARLGVQWLNGPLGEATLLLMGNTQEATDQMLPTTMAKETERVNDFITRSDQLNWMISYEGDVVGSVWVDLENSNDLPGPSVHIMIGDQNMRGKGVGSASIDAVLSYLEKQGASVIYSRHIVTNNTADQLLKSFGFEELNKPYKQSGVTYQNLIRPAA